MHVSLFIGLFVIENTYTVSLQAGSYGRNDFPGIIMEWSMRYTCILYIYEYPYTIYIYKIYIYPSIPAISKLKEFRSRYRWNIHSLITVESLAFFQIYIFIKYVIYKKKKSTWVDIYRDTLWRGGFFKIDKCARLFLECKAVTLRVDARTFLCFFFIFCVDITRRQRNFVEVDRDKWSCICRYHYYILWLIEFLLGANLIEIVFCYKKYLALKIELLKTLFFSYTC